MKDETRNKGNDLNKAIDGLMEDVFGKSGDAYVAEDSNTTADDAISAVKGGENDKDRKAGRPKQISDVPNTDEDGKREGKYDGDITENEGKEEESEETKKQAKTMDQTEEKNRTGTDKPKAPPVRPFRKGDLNDFTEFFKKATDAFMENVQKRYGMDVREEVETSEKKEEANSEEVTISKAEMEEFETLKKSKKEDEELKKNKTDKTVEALTKSVKDLTQKTDEQEVLLKAIGNTPNTSKAITNMQPIEKSLDEEVTGSKNFSKAEIGDAIFELAKSKKIPDTAMYEFDMLSTLADPEQKKTVEDYLAQKQG